MVSIKFYKASRTALHLKKLQITTLATKIQIDAIVLYSY